MLDDALGISNSDDVMCRDDTSIMNIPTNLVLLLSIATLWYL